MGREALFSTIYKEFLQKDFVGRHPRFIHLVDSLKKISKKPVPVLITGETGTGKGRCAAILHQLSERRKKPFIIYNCGDGPETLFESHLFGQSRGAFTGATESKKGLVEEADEGFLFLDEVNSLPFPSQVKLNHFLETGVFRRVGETMLRRVDVRIVAASNESLEKLMGCDKFRRDLYYRLAGYELSIPPLRERGDDIPLLAKHFLEEYAHLAEVTNVEFSECVIEKLRKYNWPGNIRELQHCIKRCLIDASSRHIKSISLPVEQKNAYNDKITIGLNGKWKEAKKKVVSAFEKCYLSETLKRNQGVVAECAREAGVHPPDFFKLMKKYNLKAADYRRKKSA